VQEGERAGPGAGATRSRSRQTLFRPAPGTASRDGIPICPYLVREGPEGALEPANPSVDPAHRCAALGDPLPQSARQQELVCLTAGHVNCPRFLRGSQLAETPPVAPAREPVSTAVIAAALVFVAALAASFGFLAVRGGFNLAIETPPPSVVAVLPSPTAASGSTPSPVVSTPPAPSSTPSAAPSTSPEPTPPPTPSPTPKPTPNRTPTPSSNRFALLTACPSTPNCWIYRIRSGDNLVSIANYFGVDYDRMRAMNPRLRVPIHAGDPLRMPTPTR